MTEYEIMTGPEVSDRAPRGICEIAIQAMTHRAFDIQLELEEILHEHINQNYDTAAYELENGSNTNRLIIYTGGDRMSVSELRDIAELYARATGYSRGNIPPNLSIFPAQDETDDEQVHVWLEFKLSVEMATEEVRRKITARAGDIELTPRHPEGSDMRAVQFRERNYAYSQVRDIVNKGTIIMDVLPVEYIQLVCEP